MTGIIASLRSKGNANSLDCRARLHIINLLKLIRRKMKQQSRMRLIKSISKSLFMEWDAYVKIGFYASWPPLACMQASRHASTCSVYRPFWRQYSDSSFLFKEAVSTTIMNLSWVLQFSAFTSSSVMTMPLALAFRFHLYRVWSAIPVSFEIWITFLFWVVVFAWWYWVWILRYTLPLEPPGLLASFRYYIPLQALWQLS